MDDSFNVFVCGDGGFEEYKEIDAAVHAVNLFFEIKIHDEIL